MRNGIGLFCVWRKQVLIGWHDTDGGIGGPRISHPPRATKQKTAFTPICICTCPTYLHPSTYLNQHTKGPKSRTSLILLIPLSSHPTYAVLTMVIILCDDTTAALTARRTIRCLYRQPLAVPNRRISTVVAWAKPRVDAFCQELAAQLAAPLAAEEGQLAGTASIAHAIHVVHLLHSTAFIAFDVFLGDCPPAVRADVVGQVEQPIHFVFVKTGDRDANAAATTTYVQRRAKLDKDVRGRLEHIRGLDKGPPPLVSDGAYALTYVDGQRIESEDQEAFWAAWMAEAKAKETRRTGQTGQTKDEEEKGGEEEDEGGTKEEEQTQAAPST